VRDLDESNDFF
jgi:hypothetical protein